MFKRLMLIAGLVVSVIAISGTHANAQFFDGWGWFGFSAFQGIVDLRGVPNPDTKTSQVQATLALKGIQIFCVNPNDNKTPATPGNAGDKTVTLVDPITLANFAGDPGQATVSFSIDLGFAEVNSNCVNPHWTPIPGSAAVGLVVVDMKSYRCKDSSNPCTNLVLRDAVTLQCTLNPVLRDPITFAPLHGQDFTCVEQ
jgi:hypothetical protein